MANGLVAVFENIGRVHWKHKEGNKRHLQPPITVHHGQWPYLLGCLPPFLTPECCQKWQMGLWQCLKTLVGSIGNTRKATKGIYNHQSQYTMANGHTSLVACPLF